jgi:DNA polymerase I-like protein with 3'-5' exonuclease and polymerase domains
MAAQSKDVITFDLETNMAHTIIWMVGWKFGGKTGYSRTPQEFKAVCEEAKAAGVTIFSGHNSIKFDWWVLKQVWGIDLYSYFDVHIDTMVLSFLLRSNQKLHSLEMLAKEFFAANDQKGKFTDFNGGFTEEMAVYCIQDVKLTHELLFVFLRKIREGKWGHLSVWLEHEVAEIIAQQIRNGFLIDIQKAMMQYAEWVAEIRRIVDNAAKMFPPKAIQMKTKVKYKPFNIASRPDCSERLIALGWLPTEFTNTGRPELNDDALEEIAALGYPIATEIARYFKLSKAAAMVHNWTLEADEDFRVHGGVKSNGAVTGRMTHQLPNLANIPKKDEVIGPICRGLFMVPEGRRLVGADASGLELRMFAHYIKDPEYTKELLEGDPHTFTKNAAGLDTRDQAKTFIYALLYGAQGLKIGSIKLGTGGDREATKREGERLIASFGKALPGLPKLKEKLQKFYPKAVPGLDGRWIPIRSKHAALNSLLQGAGAVVMKMALVIAARQIVLEGLDALFVVNVHDEFQLECSEKDAPRVASICTEAITKAGEMLGVRCPLAGEAKIGHNWHDTH